MEILHFVLNHEFINSIFLHNYYIYYCIIVNIILYLDPADLLISNGLEIVAETDSLNLTCIFRGIPLPNVRWLRYFVADEIEELENSSRINILEVPNHPNHTVSILVINEIKREDTGIYSCVGDNDVPNYIDAINYKDFNITVQCNNKSCIYIYYDMHNH